ncbi:hypothetical protein L210DRAFT_3534916 [Boletus edulis BED1]|uniref:Uncharacterized protein n=1 Tax=Boletus edulis BED1 TaxID=1328754 RepID=A0AAD4GGM7_BOLED|nr:hypothetical protein L210DRAFT_3534916 [Boletus edulis BED1]
MYPRQPLNLTGATKPVTTCPRCHGFHHWGHSESLKTAAFSSLIIVYTAGEHQHPGTTEF